MARRVSPSAADERPRDLRAVIVRTGGGFPVRLERGLGDPRWGAHQAAGGTLQAQPQPRSEEHTSELQSLMRISYAVFCLKKKTYQHIINTLHHTHLRSRIDKIPN